MSVLKHIQLKVERDFIFCTKLQREGIVFQAAGRSPKDANVIVRSADGVVPARIQSLFTDKRAVNGQVQLHVVVERHVDLAPEDITNDPYRQFGFVVAGGLFQNVFHAPEIIPSGDLVTLFGKTPFFHDRIGKEVVHVLPIFKVSLNNPECLYRPLN
jgi:hypothetical protein